MRFEALVGCTAPLSEQRTTTVADFWNTISRLENLWNSPLRVEILRILATGIFFALGVVAGRLWGMWRRYRQLKQAERGESDEVVTIEKILLDRRGDGTEVLRIRSCGRDPIETVFPNAAACDEFQARARATTAVCPLVSMDGKMGSYLLQELAIWVCGQLRERGYGHDVWVMAPVYERGALYLGGHFLSTVLLIRRDDLLRFRNWQSCAGIQVEHATHGERVLSLVAMAAEYERQAAAIASRRAAGRRSNYEETMYILDLGLDTQNADLPAKPVPWERFKSTLEERKIEAPQPGKAA
jgi:hypothetical protein